MNRKAAVLLALVLAGAAGASYTLFARNAEDAPRERARPAPTVVLAEVSERPITRTVEAVGTVRAEESVVIAAKTAGRIEEIRFRDGDVVAANDVLIRLEQTEAQAEIAVLEAEANEIAQGLARSEELLTRGFAPRGAVQDTRRRLDAARARIAAARERLDDTLLRAPFAGRVGLRDVSVGALVQPGAELVNLDSVSPIAVRFAVPERDLADVKPGARVEARTATFEGQTFTGEVRALDSRVDPALRTVDVEARFDNPGGLLRPGMLMNVSVAVGTVKAAAVVPPISVLVQGSAQFVYRVGADRKAERVEVRVGQREADWLEIVDGLTPGERIVVEGVQSVTDGQEVRVRGETGGGDPERRVEAAR